MKRVNFDELGGKPMTIALFIFKDGSIGSLEGTCRGFGPIGGGEKRSEVTVGIYEADGTYHNILIDERVECCLPTFHVDGQPYFFPVVECRTSSATVDPATGIMSRYAAGNRHDGLADARPLLTKEEVVEPLNELLAMGLVEVVGYNEGGEPRYRLTGNTERLGKFRVD